MKIVEVETWDKPMMGQCKLFYFTFDAFPTIGQRYLMNNFVEISKHVTKGIEAQFVSFGPPTIAPTVELEGSTYNVITQPDCRYLRMTFKDIRGNILMYRQPYNAFVRSGQLFGFPSPLEIRRYNLKIYTGKSFFEWGTNVFFTALPMAIPIMFFFEKPNARS